LIQPDSIFQPDADLLLADHVGLHRTVKSGGADSSLQHAKNWLHHRCGDGLGTFSWSEYRACRLQERHRVGEGLKRALSLVGDDRLLTLKSFRYLLPLSFVVWGALALLARLTRRSIDVFAV
jgi:hypothetical protein